MAGLLDVAEFFIKPSSFFGRRHAAEDAAKFQGLLGTLEQQGPVQPGGLLQSRAPDQQFWLQAAQIPSYQQMASQQLGYDAAGGQALQRQMQAQDWSAKNMTMAQAQAQQLAQQKAQADYGLDQEDLRRKWYGTQASAQSSLSSAASSDASRQLSLARLDSELLKGQRERGSLLDRLPPQNQLEARQDLLTKDTWAQAASDVADWAKNRGPGAAIPLLGTAQADSMNTEWQTSVRPALMQMMNTGVLQEGEREALEAIMGQPADKVLTQSQQNVIQTIAQKIRDLRADTYKAAGLKAPELVKGGSAASRTLSQGQPRGAVRPVGQLPEAGSANWRPVQRY